MVLIAAAVGPAIVLLFYFYLRDRYEKEPLRLLFKALLLGAFIVVPAVPVEILIGPQGPLFPSSYYMGGLLTAGYTAFVVAGLVEEGFKYLAVRIFLYRRPEFNEMYDGIVYAVFVSLGFAIVENVIYVLNEGLQVAVIRAFTAVPAHAMFGATMGYYFGRAKFTYSQHKGSLMSMALIVPVILHGVYNFILLSRIPALLVFFIPFIIFVWIRVSRQIKQLSENSPFR